MRMRAIVCRNPHEIVQEDRPAAARAEGEVLVRVRRVGICGTDYHIHEGLQPFLSYPRLIGHELAAEVVDAPEGSGWVPGQLVVVNPYIACGTCHACAGGKPNCCMRIAVLGVHRDGGMCDLISLPPGNLIAAEGLSADQAASVEYLAIGAHAVRRGALAPGARVLVVGAGPIGIGAALFARIAGGQVTVMDRDAARLALVAAVTGMAGGILADGQEAAHVAKATGGNGFDAVFDATGNKASMEAGFAHVAHGGVYVLVGLVKAPITFEDPEFHKREMTLMASRNATAQDFATVLAAIRAGQVPVDRLITHRTTMDRVCTDLPRWARDKAGLIKAMVGLD